MTRDLDPIIASARIATPEEAAIDMAEFLAMRLALALARRAGTPAHIVQFADGVAAMVVGDPNDAAAWRNTLTQVHAAALNGLVGPIQIKE